MSQVEAPSAAKIRSFLSNKDWRFYAAALTPVVVAAAAVALYYVQRETPTPQTEKERRKRKRKQRAAEQVEFPPISSTPSEETLSPTATATADPDYEVEQFTPEQIAAMSLDTRKAKAAAIKSRGNLAYGRSKYDAAILLYSAAIQLRPDPVYYSNRAACYANLDQNEKVIEDCNAALKMDKEYVKALNRRAIAYETAEKYEEALQDYTAACIIDGFKNETASIAMERLLKKVADDKTVELMKIKKHKLPSPTFVTAYLESFRKASEDQDEENGEATEVETANGSTEYLRARALMKSRNYTAAAAAADRAVLLGAGDYRSKALALRGTFSFLSGRAEDALSDFETALELDPSDTQIRIKKASIMMEKGDADGTIREFEDAIKINPDDADVYYHRGQIKYVTGDFVGATADYTRSLELDANFVFVHIQLGVAQYKLNTADASAAMKTFSNALNKFPKSADLRIYYGEILLDQQKLDEAKASFEKASQLDPSNPLPFINLALLHFQWMEDPSTAEAMCRKALVVDPECDVALATLGQLLLQQGKITEAASVFDQSIELARTEGELASAMGYREAAATQIRFAKEYPQFAARLAASGGQL